MNRGDLIEKVTRPGLLRSLSIRSQEGMDEETKKQTGT